MLDRLQLLLAGSLLVVVEVGGEPLVAVLAFRERRFELGDLGFEGGRARRVVRFLAHLFWIVRMLSRGHLELNTARTGPVKQIKSQAGPCVRWRHVPRPAAGRRSGCKPSGSGRSRLAPLSAGSKGHMR